MTFTLRSTAHSAQWIQCHSAKNLVLTVQAAHAKGDIASPPSPQKSSGFRLKSATLSNMLSVPPSTRFRFGVFEANASTGELRKQGIRIKLNVQPFQVLLLLLERPNEILTRDEIARHLWPDGTFVDFDHGVNSAVNRIRDALGDPARNPRFIETLARRGYRFVAPVQRFNELGPESSSPLPHVLAAASEPEPETLTFLATPEELPQASPRTVKVLFLLFQLMYVSFYVGALANLPEIGEIFAVLSHPTVALTGLLVTAALLIPVRAFVLSATILHPPRIRAKLLRLWPFLLVADELWALAPFLLLHHINLGVALSCTALLAYAPFAQRSLVLMGAAEQPAG
jgi:cholera toxin transcriptional activator